MTSNRGKMNKIPLLRMLTIFRENADSVAVPQVSAFALAANFASGNAVERTWLEASWLAGDSAGLVFLVQSAR